MATQAQIDANRANAQKSTGPRTPEGRAAVRQNALKHGLTSMSPVAPGEDPAEFLEFLDHWTQAYQPFGPAEEEVLRTAVVASWRLRRIPAIEVGYYEMELCADQSPSPAARLAFAHYQCARQLEALSRQEARLQRTYDKSIREIERLQTLRARTVNLDSENQTQSSAEPVEEAAPANQTQSPGQTDASPAAVQESNLENQSQFAREGGEGGASTQPGEPEAQNLENQTQFPTQIEGQPACFRF